MSAAAAHKREVGADAVQPRRIGCGGDGDGEGDEGEGCGGCGGCDNRDGEGVRRREGEQVGRGCPRVIMLRQILGFCV